MKRIAVLAATVLLSTALPAHSASSNDCFGERPTYVGTKGNDIVWATMSNTVIYTGAGNDTVYVDSDLDAAVLVCLGPGKDRLDSGGYVTRAHGGDGYDTADMDLCGSTRLFAFEAVMADTNNQETCK
jgi:Ca2+-binding RTX toxin-like protein